MFRNAMNELGLSNDCKPARLSCRPAVEALEDRTVPATPAFDPTLVPQVQGIATRIDFFSDTLNKTLLKLKTVNRLLDPFSLAVQKEGQAKNARKLVQALDQEVKRVTEDEKAIENKPNFCNDPNYSLAMNTFQQSSSRYEAISLRVLNMALKLLSQTDGTLHPKP